MRRRTKLFILLLVVAIIATSAAYAIQIHEYALQGSKSRPMRTNTSLKKDTTGSALVAITSVYNMESERYLGADVYGWADVYLYRDAYNFQIATSTSGTDNKVTVGMGINGKEIPYLAGRGIVNANYRLQIRLPSEAASSDYIYAGRWSPN